MPKLHVSTTASTKFADPRPDSLKDWAKLPLVFFDTGGEVNIAHQEWANAQTPKAPHLANVKYYDPDIPGSQQAYEKLADMAVAMTPPGQQTFLVVNAEDQGEANNPVFANTFARYLNNPAGLTQIAESHIDSANVLTWVKNKQPSVVRGMWGLLPAWGGWQQWAKNNQAQYQTLLNLEAAAIAANGLLQRSILPNYVNDYEADPMAAWSRDMAALIAVVKSRGYQTTLAPCLNVWHRFGEGTRTNQYIGRANFKTVVTASLATGFDVIAWNVGQYVANPTTQKETEDKEAWDVIAEVLAEQATQPAPLPTPTIPGSVPTTTPPTSSTTPPVTTTSALYTLEDFWLDAGDQPVPNAVIQYRIKSAPNTAHGIRSGKFLESRTNAQGKFSIGLAPGGWVYVVRVYGVEVEVTTGAAGLKGTLPVLLTGEET